MRYLLLMLVVVFSGSGCFTHQDGEPSHQQCCPGCPDDNGQCVCSDHGCCKVKAK